MFAPAYATAASVSRIGQQQQHAVKMKVLEIMVQRYGGTDEQCKGVGKILTLTFFVNISGFLFVNQLIMFFRARSTRKTKKSVTT
jgi:hypothetical protein